MEFVFAPSAAAAGLLRGRKDTRAPMLFTLIGQWGIGAPVGLYLCEAMGLGVAGSGSASPRARSSPHC